MTSMEPFFDQCASASESCNSAFVEPEEYYQLLLGWRKMVRVDHGGSDVCGLMDPHSGKQYLIKRRRLLQE